LLAVGFHFEQSFQKKNSKSKEKKSKDSSFFGKKEAKKLSFWRAFVVVGL